MADMISSIALQMETQSLNYVVAGFAFASAVSWSDVARWIISQLVQVGKNGGQYYFLSALFTTLISIVVYMAIKALAKNVTIKEPQVAYAVTRA
jgi:di/tricarboxylate transporter